ncbi:hypothetical protein Acor_71100 [Acrocarpospora corrugata]|uniref:Uncharacterized protein n=1 Tax=Acrocarpospora corrugata TaxID=35763 RepID=A0A5M3WAJ2_9ACTN|nr:hypothetical protein Acor_71100 [Acrocarpospora corrugata]
MHADPDRRQHDEQESRLERVERPDDQRAEHDPDPDRRGQIPPGTATGGSARILISRSVQAVYSLNARDPCPGGGHVVRGSARTRITVTLAA